MNARATWSVLYIFRIILLTYFYFSPFNFNLEDYRRIITLNQIRNLIQKSVYLLVSFNPVKNEILEKQDTTLTCKRKKNGDNLCTLLQQIKYKAKYVLSFSQKMNTNCKPIVIQEINRPTNIYTQLLLTWTNFVK